MPLGSGLRQYVLAIVTCLPWFTPTAHNLEAVRRIRQSLKMMHPVPSLFEHTVQHIMTKRAQG